MHTEVIRKDWVGNIVGKQYLLVEWLGSFGQSGVYRCEIDGHSERKATIKLFPAAIEGSAACASGWAMASNLSHPHLIRVLETGQDQVDGTRVLYVVTEFAEEILSEILRERPLTPDEVKQMLPPIIDVLRYLHEEGLVHARLKPSNIMVIDDELKLSSENIRGAAAAFTPPRVLETYDAPEKSLGHISPATDMWSLGVTLVEALTRIPPAWNRSGQIEPLVPPSVPEPFNQIARECLRLDPANRCTLDEMRACLASGTAIPHRPIKPKAAAKVKAAANTRPPVERTEKGRGGMIAAAAVILLAGIGITVLKSHHSATSPASQNPQTTSTQPQDQAPATPESTPSQAAPAAQTQTPAPEAPAPQTQAPALQNQPPSAPPTTSTQPQQAPNPAVTTPTPAQAPTATQARTQPVPSPVARATSGASAKGAVAQKVMPDVPERASRTIHGTVKVGIRVNVDPSGSVGGAAIDTQGPSRYFANLALEAARNWKFEPAQANGQSVASVWMLQFEFRQDGTQVLPTEQSP